MSRSYVDAWWQRTEYPTKTLRLRLASAALAEPPSLPAFIDVAFDGYYPSPVDLAATGELQGGAMQFDFVGNFLNKTARDFQILSAVVVSIIDGQSVPLAFFDFVPGKVKIVPGPNFLRITIVIG